MVATSTGTTPVWSGGVVTPFVTNHEVEARFCELIDRYLAPNSVVLDAGCGEWGHVSHFRRTALSVIGVDVSNRAVKRNETIDHGIVGNVVVLPFAAEVFGAVTCQWVVEHLNDPPRFFEELHRVLKPGGTLFIMTPNLINYEAVASKLIPNRYHAPLVKKLIGRNEEDTFPTYYRSNTPWSLHRGLSRAGFRQLEMKPVDGMPNHWGFSRPLALCNRAYRRVTNIGALRWGKTHLVCAYRKC